MNEYPTGWVCPRCAKVNSPHVLFCQCGVRDEDQDDMYRSVTVHPDVAPCRTIEPVPLQRDRATCATAALDHYSTRNRPAA